MSSISTHPGYKSIEDYDLHLNQKAIGALGKADDIDQNEPNLPNVDIDGEPRPAVGDDIGADTR